MSDEADLARLKELIRDVGDFPQPGIVFKDITPLLADAKAFGWVVRRLAERFGALGVNRVLGIEARGFIVAAPVAFQLEAGFVPARKNGKLPWDTIGIDYELEYGAERLELHSDAVTAGDRVLIVDDVLATGGTARAAADAVARLGATVSGIGVIIELEFLRGRKKLEDLDLYSILTY
ncbi:MAG: adenine phosphoribosyltransferase [Actinomycetota bacterium]